MKNKREVIFSVVVGLIMASGSLFAHHSEALYDKERLHTLKGIVTRHALVNPHQLIFMKVKDANGQVKVWTLQGNPPSGTRPWGWTNDTLKPGDEITLTCFPCKDGRSCGTWMRIVKADGTELPLPGFKKRILAEFLQHHGLELSDEEYEIYKRSVTTGLGAVADPAKKSASPGGQGY